MVPNFCVHCGAELKAEAKFCPFCGKTLAQPVPQAAQPVPQATQPVPQAVQPAQQVRTAAEALLRQSAPAQDGEIALGSFGGGAEALGAAQALLSPLQTLRNEARAFARRFTAMFKERNWKKLLPAAALGMIWLTLMLLSHFGISIPILNWLTFAQGGVGRSLPGWLGGLLGKTTVAAALVSMLSGGLPALGGGCKALFRRRGVPSLGPLLLGAGGALVLYQFYAGSAHWTDLMSALSGAALSLVALGRGDGFLARLAQALTAKKTGGLRLPDREKADGLLAGAALGFTLGAAVSLIPFGWLPVILGGACLLAGLVLTIVLKPGKEAAAR